MQENEQSEHWARDVLSKYFQTIHKEQVRDRRWVLVLRTLRTLGFLMMMIVAYVIMVKPNLLPWDSPKSRIPHTAVVTIKGTISADSSTNADTLIPAIKSAFENTLSKGVILRINSPGGSAVQAGLLYDEIKAQRALHPEKPVYAVIDDIGASGGYYIAVAADKVFANRASLVGSIGVISSSFGFTGLMEKLGVERRAITAGANKDLLDPFSPLSDETKQFWESVLAQTHKQFIDRVKESRGDLLTTTEPGLFSGLVWNGEQAVKMGLIDGLESAESVARTIVGEQTLVNYTPREDMFSKLASKATLEAARSLDSLSGFSLKF
ncbi:S49 family peptidase [Eoetvoesiella caeni]